MAQPGFPTEIVFSSLGSNDCTSIVDPASVSLPGVSEVQAEEEQELNAAETSLQALEVASPRDCPSSPTSVAEEQVLNAAETSSKASEVASPGECPTSPTSAAEDQLLNATETSSKASEVASPGECPTSHILVAEEQVLNAAENSSKALEVAFHGECPSSPTSVVEEQVLNAAETASKALEVVSSYECPSSPTSVTEEQELNAGKSSSQASELALPRECPSSSVGANVSFMKGSDGMSTFVVPEETDHVEDVSTFLAPEETERMQDVSTFLAPEETERVQDVSTFLVPEETQRVQNVSTSIAPEETERVQDVSTFLAPEETERVQDASTFLAPEEAERVQDVLTSIAPEETERVQDASSFLAPEEAECVQDVSISIAPEETERVQDVSTFIAPEETERVQNVSTFIAPEETQSVQDVSTFLAPEETPREQDFSTFLVPEETERVEDISTSLVPEETDRVDHYVMDEQQPAKRAKTSGTTYSGADAVAIVLGQTAEIVLVLAGMAHMRAGRIPTSYERELAATAYQNLGILVSQVAPNNLVTKESLERLLQDYNIKKVAQKKREDQAWVEALTEAEALANARVEAVARAKAEAAARAQAEMVARAQAEAAAKAEAEAKELERRRQAALKAAAIPAANGPSTGGFSSVGGSPLASGQSAYRVSELAQSPSLVAPGVHANSQAEMGSQVLLPVSSVGEIPRLVTQTEKSMSVNGQPHTLASKPTLGKPPKVRNRVRKEPAAFTLFAPEFLNVVQSQVPDPQKAHVTHKELCLGVQQFIREQIPPVSQNLQALPPTYISTPFPCQVCKLIAKDTGSVLVCDSCDEVSHVKCVQPPTSRGASKGDWNCPKCLTASRGGKYPSKYGPILYGSPNSVKLWPPHDMSQGNLEPSNSISIASVREREWAAGGRQISPELLAGQGKAGLEMDTRPHLSMEDATTGNFGNSPHLIVHLVNEPSPRTANPFSSSQSPFQEDKRGPFASEKSITSLELETASQKVLTKHVATLKKTQVQGKTGMIMSDPSDGLKVLQGNQKFEKGLDKSDSQVRAGVVEDTAHEAKNRRATPAHNKKTEARTQANQSKKGNADLGVILASRPAEVPLPIVMEWVGDSGRRAEGKIYYQACSVGGITFSVSDCALFRPETPDVPPYIARLQVLWEDIATGHKWVRVSWCYYPTDIPLAMGRPGTTAPDEVYESNHCDNNLVGAIQGPCFVLTPLKFIEETERRRTLEKRGDAVEQLPPIFLARWMYDAPKGVFKPLPE